jgi:hypothetical protein
MKSEPEQGQVKCRKSIFTWLKMLVDSTYLSLFLLRNPKMKAKE